MPNESANAVEVDHLTKKFGDLVAVNDISFNVTHKEIFALLGPNGAGKTTLIRMMTTLTPPTSGTARIAGHDIRTDADGVRHAMGVIPQALTSDPELTAVENMTVHARLYGIPSAERAKIIPELLESVDLLKFKDALVRTFSGGMRRRLEIARGLIHSPRILFLDEPTTGLDPVSRANVWDLIRKLREGSDLTILLTTHYMDEADKLCDRIAIVDHGKLAVLDTPARLKDSVPGTDTVEAEFDAPPTDWEKQLAALAQAAGVTQHDGLYHISSNDGPATVAALMDLTRQRAVHLRKVTVQSTTLDDVFIHYTGKELRDTASAGGHLDIGHLYR
ncbi:MAG: ATP-binding cassette domain-containing protein [Candidatus Acidiferrales bacterium]